MIKHSIKWYHETRCQTEKKRKKETLQYVDHCSFAEIALKSFSNLSRSRACHQVH